LVTGVRRGRFIESSSHVANLVILRELPIFIGKNKGDEKKGGMTPKKGALPFPRFVEKGVTR
jgi:hypothetical protein